MKKQEWLIVFLPLIAIWYLDRITKSWASSLLEIKSYGVIHFSLHHNPGAILGLFADLPPVLRIVSLSTAGAFLVVIYALLQYLIPIKSLILRTGLSVLLGGILGNVTDRILWGHVIDFIILGRPGFLSPAFNLADLIQWVGYFMIIFAVVRDGEILWPENNNRKRFWINPKFQLKYCFMLLGVGASLSLIAMVFSYTYLRVVMTELAGNNPMLLQKMLNPFVITFGFITAGFSVGLFTVGKLISHKIAGPIYAFDKYMHELINAFDKQSSVRKFKLRTQDEFKELEELANILKNKFASGVKEMDVIPQERVAEDTDPNIKIAGT